MSPSTSQTATSEALDNPETEKARLEKFQAGQAAIRQALQSIAQLRRYLLTEHPQLLPEAAPSLIVAETQVFDIWGRLGKK